MSAVAEKAHRPQKFIVNRASEATFEPGLRDYLEYRDLGMVEGTHGMVRAHVLRVVKPCPKAGTGRHSHTLDFQMNYILKGWARFEFEGQGEMTLQAGDSWLQPSGIKHTLLDYSDDWENIEITMPADFDTVDP